MTTAKGAPQKKRGLGRGLEALLGPKGAAQAPVLEATPADTALARLLRTSNIVRNTPSTSSCGLSLPLSASMVCSRAVRPSSA